MSASTPHFVLENDVWCTSVRLRSWEAYGASVRSKISGLFSGKQTKLVFAPEGRETDPMNETETSLALWFLENEGGVVDAMLDAVIEEYPAIQEEYDYSDEEKAEYMPDIRSKKDLRKLIELQTVYIHPIQKDGIPYIGFSFECTWDEEHGLGVLMHGTRKVRIGGADTAMTLWMARRDAEEPR